MDKPRPRFALLAAVLVSALAIVGVVWLLQRAKPTPITPAAPESSPITITAAPVGSAQPRSPPEPETMPPTIPAQHEHEDPEPVPVPGVSPRSEEPPENITGDAPYPTGGKPMGPCDLAWQLSRRGDTVSGSIVVKNLSADAPVELVITANGTAILNHPYVERASIARGQSHVFPITVTTGAGVSSLTVTATHLLYDRRSRTIAIDLTKPDTAALPAEKAVVSDRPHDLAAPLPVPQPEPQPGTVIIQDDHGERIKLQPALPEK